ncbi:RHS repeat domain-containing protein, partial [Thiorhodococcus minor]
LVETRQGTGDDARLTTYAYDAHDHLAQITDAEGQVTRYTPDALGRVTAIERPDGALTGLDDDAKGNLAGVTPPERPEHRLGYTPVDLEDDDQPPGVDNGTGAIARAYDKDRDLTQLSHALGPQIGYGYDAAGRLDRRTTAAGATTYTYAGPTERIATITTPEGEVLTFDYDGALTIDTQWSGTLNGRVETDWNSDLAIAAHIINDSHSISYAYDGDGLLTQAGALILERHAGNGLLTGTTLGGLTTTQGYNAFGELATQQAAHDATTLYQIGYSRDRLGRITEKTETLQGQTTVYAYDYDAAGRLIAVRENGTVTGSWDYDPNGNRISVNGAANGTYDDQDRLLDYDAPARPRPSGTIGYVIDGQDRRIGKTRDGELVQGFLYKDQLNPIAELDGEGNLVAVFVYGEQANVPAYLIKIDPETQEETTYRILSDHLGSPRLVVAVETGAVVQRMDYDAWGVVTRDTQPGFQPFGFAGGLYEPETGLVRFGARDYDPYTGRWLGKDPIGFGGGQANLYSYILGNPLLTIDPWGLIPNCWEGLPKSSISTSREMRVKTIKSLRFPHPEGWRPSVGGNFPSSGSLPIGPEIAADWWMWEHRFRQYSEYEITRTVTVTRIYCEEKRDCFPEPLKFHYDRVEDGAKTERLADKYTKWEHEKLYRIGSNSWPFP